MWNPVDPGTVEDPFPFWCWLRREAPVYEVPGAEGYFLVSRYADILEVTRDAESFASDLQAVLQRDEEGRPRLARTQLIGEPQAQVLGVADGETHARHRRVVGRTFSPSRMERMSQLALEIAERCIECFADTGEIEVVEALAIPVPRELTTQLLGLPLEDQPRLQHWTDQAFLMAGALAGAEELATAWEATEGFHAYLADRLAEALSCPGEDVLGDLARAIRARERGEEGLEPWEARAILYQLVVGGVETTVGLITATIHHATIQPGAWRRLREAPDQLTSFIEEVIRLDGPAIGNYRRTTRDVELAGVRLPKGSTLTLLWGSANRDEAQFPEPERFVVDRPNIKTHLGFGLGKHFCLGAALARMETRVTLQGLLRRYERLVPLDQQDMLRHRPSLQVRRLASLRVAPG